MKTILLINSALWVAAAVYFFYAMVVGLITLDWHIALQGLLVIGFFTLTEVIFALLAS